MTCHYYNNNTQTVTTATNYIQSVTTTTDIIQPVATAVAQVGVFARTALSCN